MNLEARLHRLEQRKAGDSAPPPIRDPIAAAKALDAYFRGEGPCPPDPPCPSWFDPAEWERRMLVSRCMKQRIAGELEEGEYLPGMTDAERQQVDAYCRALLATRVAENRPSLDGDLPAAFQGRLE